MRPIVTSSTTITSQLLPNVVEKNISSLERYAENRGWAVEYNKKYKCDSFWYSDTRKIVKLKITRRTRESVLYVLLHELGHMVIESKTPYQAPIGNYNTDTYRFSKVQQEIEAWDAGLSLAKRKRLHIDEQKFQRVRAYHLMTYFLWATRKKTNAINNKFINEYIKGSSD